jgi:hypothetical protein
MYQWFANGFEIESATASTLSLTQDLIGKTITVRVTGEQVDYATTAVMSVKTSAILLTPFTQSAIPVIIGTPLIGETLTVNLGTWNVGASFSYVWRRGSAVVGTAAEYTLSEADRKSPITVAVTATKTGFIPMTRTSLPTAQIGGPFASLGSPSITGVLAVGKTLTAIPGSWSPMPAFTYQWFRGGSAIPAATRNTYVLVAADRGAEISVRVTGRLAGYLSSSSDSQARIIAG